MTDDDPIRAKPHQRIGALSNAHAGREFEDAVQRYFTAQGLSLQRDFAVDIGHTIKKGHRFDLGDTDARVLIECKSYAWTVTGKSPSAKIRSLNEAMLHFVLTPPGFRKILVMMKSERLSGGESLGSYYMRTQGHLVPPDVEVWQFDLATGSAERVMASQTEPLRRRVAPPKGNQRMPNTADFTKAIESRLRDAARKGTRHIDINAGDLHRELGGYPGPNASMPSCCNAMYARQKPGDEVLARPPKGKGASLTIRYHLSA